VFFVYSLLLEIVCVEFAIIAIAATLWSKNFLQLLFSPIHTISISIIGWKVDD